MPALSLLASKLFSVSVIVPVSTSASVSVCVLSVTVSVILSRVLRVISQFKSLQSLCGLFIVCTPPPSTVISLYSLFVHCLISRHSTIVPCSRWPFFCLRPLVPLSDHLILTTASMTTISAWAPLKPLFLTLCIWVLSFTFTPIHFLTQATRLLSGTVDLKMIHFVEVWWIREYLVDILEQLQWNHEYHLGKIILQILKMSPLPLSTAS